MTLPGDDEYKDDDIGHMPEDMQSLYEETNLSPEEWSQVRDETDRVLDMPVDKVDLDGSGDEGEYGTDTVNRVRDAFEGTSLESHAREFLNEPGEVTSSAIGALIGLTAYAQGSVEVALMFAAVALGLSRAQMQLSDRVMLNVKREPWYAIAFMAIAYTVASLAGPELMNAWLELLRNVAGGWMGL